MSDPPRWLSQEGGAPPEVRALLSAAKPPPSMPPEALRASAVFVRALGPASAAWKALLLKGVVGVSMTAALTAGAYRLSERPPARARETVSLPRAAHAPPAVAPAPVAPTPLQPVPALVPPPEPAPTAAPTPLALVPPAPRPARTRSASDEQRAMEEIRVAVGPSPARALDLLREAARTYGRSQSTEERQYITVRALHNLGRAAEARAEGERFLARYPSGIYTAHVRQMLGTP